MRYALKDFLPLIVLFSLIAAFTAIRQWFNCCNAMEAMSDFMGAFFIIFGTFKLLKWQGFATAYQEYDIIAARSKIYAYAYPIIEVGLGIAYLLRIAPITTSVITLLLMVISSIGVFNELRKGKEIVCACLGTVFKVPMTYVTLIEDLLMAAMALYMIMVHYGRF